MDRRRFLSSLAAGAVTPALLHGFSARADAAAVPEIPFDPRLTPLRGFAGQDISCDALAIEGVLPEELRGTFYRNGPGLFERGTERYRHWFDGDGLVHAYRFTGSGISHRARFVHTPKFDAESRAGRFLVSGFGTSIHQRMAVNGPDSFNTANTNVVAHAGKLFALWEGGSATALDPATLETLGPVSWRPDWKGMPFSAHPKREPDGTLWNFGNGMGKLVLYQISPDGTLAKSAIVETPTCAALHDFAVSEKHLILLLPPITLDAAAFRAGASMGESMRWDGSRPTSILVIDKADFSRRTLIEMPSFMVFHFGNAWEEASGVIHVDFVKSDDLAIMTEWMPRMMAGATEGPHQKSCPAFLSIDVAARRASLSSLDVQCEFPRVDPRVVGKRHRYVYYPSSVASSRDQAGFNTLMRLEPESGKLDLHTFHPTMFLEEHIVVPRPGSTKEGDGWLVGAGFDARRQQNFVTVLDALDLARGPLAIARLPYWVPQCFHGNFLAA